MRLLPWRRRRELDKRVQDAEREADLSRRRLEAASEHVVEPLRRAAQRNNFAELLRQSLVIGHHRGEQGR